jgi:hypothetical protein
MGVRQWEQVSFSGLLEFRLGGSSRRQIIVLQHLDPSQKGAIRVARYAPLREATNALMLNKPRSRIRQEAERLFQEGRQNNDKALIDNAEAIFCLLERFHSKSFVLKDKLRHDPRLAGVVVRVTNVHRVFLEDVEYLALLSFSSAKHWLDRENRKIARQLVYGAQLEKGLQFPCHRVVFYDVPHDSFSPMKSSEEWPLTDLEALCRDYKRIWQMEKVRLGEIARGRPLSLFPCS